MSIITCLGGTLVRHSDGRYIWKDGEYWPGAFRDQTINCYNFLISGGLVHVPANMANVHMDLEWVRAEGLRRGKNYLVQVEEWDKRAKTPIGVLWDESIEHMVLDKAKDLGWVCPE